MVLEMKHLIIFGPPGSGKGTVSEEVGRVYGIPHISTGDLLREHVSKKTTLGMKAKKYMDRGELVPDDLVNEILEDALSREECRRGFILDGYPRTVAQAEELERILSKLGLHIDWVINLNVSEDEIVKRLSTRRVCKVCGAVYNLVTNPPKAEGVCDRCGGALILREDDKPEVVRTRLQTYVKMSAPVLNYYVAKNKVLDIDGSGDVATVRARVLRALEEKSVAKQH
jgi:adenylate kinase